MTWATTLDEAWYVLTNADEGDLARRLEDEAEMLLRVIDEQDRQIAALRELVVNIRLGVFGVAKVLYDSSLADPQEVSGLTRCEFTVEDWEDLL